MVVISRVFAVVGAAVAAVVLSGCGGSSDAATQPVVNRPEATTAPVMTISESPAVTTQAPIGETVPIGTGDVTVVVVAGLEVGSYGVQFQALPSLDGSWSAQVSEFAGVAADGSKHPASSSSQWPANPTVTASQSIFGGTLTFDTAIVELIYTAPDGTSVAWQI